MRTVFNRFSTVIRGQDYFLKCKQISAGQLPRQQYQTHKVSEIFKRASMHSGLLINALVTKQLIEIFSWWLTLAGRRVVGPLRESGYVGVTNDAEAANQLVAMVTAERTRAAVSVDSRRTVT